MEREKDHHQNMMLLWKLYDDVYLNEHDVVFLIFFYSYELK